MLYLLPIPFLLLLIPVNRTAVFSCFLYLLLCRCYGYVRKNDIRSKLSFRFSRCFLLMGGGSLLLLAINLIALRGDLETTGEALFASTGHGALILIALFVPASFLFAVLLGTVGADFRDNLPAFRQAWQAWSGGEQNTRRDAFLCSAALVLLLLIAQNRMPLWQNSDNFWISNVLNGVFSGQDNRCLFLNPVVAMLVRWIDALLPKADGFLLLGEFLVTNGIWAVTYAGLRSMPKKRALVLFTVFFLLNFRWNVLHLPFTAMAGLLGAMGFLLCHGAWHRRIGLGGGILGVVYLTFAAMWRYEAFLLLVPYFGLILGAELVEHRIGKQLCLPRVLGLVLAAVILCGGTELIRSRELGYAEGQRFNAVRADIVDYPMKPWDEVGEALEEIGVTENDYVLLQLMTIPDTERITADYLEDVRDIGAYSTRERLWNGKWQMTVQCVSAFFETDRLMLETLLLGVFLIALLLSGQSRLQKTEGILGAVGTVLIFGYLAYRGHAPEYVAQAVLCGFWCVVLTLLTRAELQLPRAGAVSLLCLGLVLPCLFSVETQQLLGRESMAFKSVSCRTVSTEDVVGCDPDPATVYLWYVYLLDDVVMETDYFTRGSLLSPAFLEHNVADGDWMYGQSYYGTYLEQIGMSNPADALLHRAHTYYVGDAACSGRILQYFREHGYPDAEMTCCGTGKNYCVWAFTPE